MLNLCLYFLQRNEKSALAVGTVIRFPYEIPNFFPENKVPGNFLPQKIAPIFFPKKSRMNFYPKIFTRMLKTQKFNTRKNFRDNWINDTYSHEVVWLKGLFFRYTVEQSRPDQGFREEPIKMSNSMSSAIRECDRAAVFGIDDSRRKRALQKKPKEMSSGKKLG